MNIFLTSPGAVLDLPREASDDPPDLESPMGGSMKSDAAGAAPVPPPFEDHLRDAVGAVRGAILEVMTTAGADPNRPREVARQLGLRTGLTWKLCKVVQETEPLAAVQHIPGPTGLKLFFDAVAKAGVPSRAVDAAREAGDAFESMVRIHTGDRQTLLTMMGQLDDADRLERAEADRKLAFQGNRAIWGVQCRSLHAAAWICPNAEDPTHVDVANVVGFHGFQRLRTDASWVLARSAAYNADGTPREEERLPLDDDCEPGAGPSLFHAFCTNLPEMAVVREGLSERIEVRPGPVGHTAAATIVFGSYARRFAPRARDGVNDEGENPALLFTPAEQVVTDLFIHRDLAFTLPPKPTLFSCLYHGIGGWPVRASETIPVLEPIIDLGQPAHVGLTQVPRYQRMATTVVQKLGAETGDFHGYRLVMKYPPVPTVLTLAFRLEDPA